jgi:hypothetical protein
MKSPRNVARVLLAFILGSTIWADYWEYGKNWPGNPDWDVLRGTADAPWQYRIGVARAAQFLVRHGHMGLRHAFTIIDLVCGAIAVYALYSLMERSKAYQAAQGAARWFCAAAFLLLVAYYFSWITWYQKPETMASCALLAATVWLLGVPLPLAKWAAIGLAGGGIVVLAAMQGFVRADVAFAINVGSLLLCLTRAPASYALPRAVQATVSASSVLVSGGIQYYLMHVVYPNARYAPGRVFQGLANIASPLRIAPFVLFMLPYAWLVIQVLRKRATADSPQAALVAGSAFYLALWWALGNFDEVRIFLPYVLALVPFTAICAMQRFAMDDAKANA